MIDREEVVERLEALDLGAYEDSDERLSAICKTVNESAFGWTLGACEVLRERLVRLIGGDGDGCSCEGNGDGVRAAAGRADGDGQPSGIALMAEYHRGFVDGCKLRETATWQLSMERDGVVRKLRKLNSENFRCKQFMGDLLSAIDPDWISKASMYDDATLNEYMRDRLIHLLGGECNFSGAESYIGASDSESNPAETQRDGGNHAISDTEPSPDAETFEEAAEYARDVLADCDLPLISRLQAAHARELRTQNRVMSTKYDVVGNERHKAADVIRAIDVNTGGFVKNLASALGIKWDGIHPRGTMRAICNRLSYLLEGIEYENCKNVDICETDAAEGAADCKETDKKGYGDGMAGVFCDSGRGVRGCVASGETEVDTITSGLRESGKLQAFLRQGTLDRCIENDRFIQLCDEVDETHKSTVKSLLDELVATQHERDEALDRLHELDQSGATTLYKLLKDAAGEHATIGVPEAVAFARRIEQAAKRCDDVTLFGVDYMPMLKDRVLRYMGKAMGGAM